MAPVCDAGQTVGGAERGELVLQVPLFGHVARDRHHAAREVSSSDQKPIQVISIIWFRGWASGFAADASLLAERYDPAACAVIPG